VLTDEKNSRADRKDKRNSKLRKELATADAVLQKLFPRFPKQAQQHQSVLQRAWTVGTGRVGRTAALTLEEKVRLAVQAHARHEYTEYDALLKEGKSKVVARAAIQSKLQQVLDGWVEESLVKKDKRVKPKLTPAGDRDMSKSTKILTGSPAKVQPKSSSRSPARRTAPRRKRTPAGKRKPRAT
jgi:hypothetical protein